MTRVSSEQGRHTKHAAIHTQKPSPINKMEEYSCIHVTFNNAHLVLHELWIRIDTSIVRSVTGKIIVLALSFNRSRLPSIFEMSLVEEDPYALPVRLHVRYRRCTRCSFDVPCSSCWRKKAASHVEQRFQCISSAYCFIYKTAVKR